MDGRNGLMRATGFQISEGALASVLHFYYWGSSEQVRFGDEAGTRRSKGLMCYDFIHVYCVVDLDPASALSK
jgi:hypothetical protein